MAGLDIIHTKKGCTLWYNLFKYMLKRLSYDNFLNCVANLYDIETICKADC